MKSHSFPEFQGESVQMQGRRVGTRWLGDSRVGRRPVRLAFRGQGGMVGVDGG